MIPRIEVYRDLSLPHAEQWLYRVYSKSGGLPIVTSTRRYHDAQAAQHGAWALVTVCGMITEIKIAP